VGIIAVPSDVSKLRDLDTLFEVVSKKLGRIDVLFASAGIAKFAPVSDVSEDAYDETFDIKLLHRPEGHPLSERQCFSHSEHVVR